MTSALAAGSAEGVMVGVLGLEEIAIPAPLAPLDLVYTNAKVKPAWSGARPMEIPPWLWFR